MITLNKIYVTHFDIMDISAIITFPCESDIINVIDSDDLDGECIPCYVCDGYGNVFTMDNKLLRYPDGSFKKD